MRFLVKSSEFFNAYFGSKVIGISENLHAEDPIVQYIPFNDKTKTEANHIAACGQALMDICHLLINIICLQYIKTMADRCYVHGVIQKGRMHRRVMLFTLVRDDINV